MATINRTVRFTGGYHVYTLAGDCYLVRQAGNKWVIDGHPGAYKTKGAAQDAIRENKVQPLPVEPQGEIVPQEPAESLTEDNTQDTAIESTWGCVHPAAFMVLFGSEGLDFRGSPQDRVEFEKTLDNLGYLMDDGRWDVATAQRERRRIQQMKE